MGTSDDRLWLVTGCGNSGTGWASELFRGLGYRCGHERWHNQHPYRGMEGPDSAWPAVANLAQVPPSIPVVWLVRNPLAVLRSAARAGFLAAPDAPYAQIIARVAPDIMEPAGPIDRLIRWICWWDEPVDKRAGRLLVRIEDCTPEDPEPAVDMVEHCTGRRPAGRRIADELQRIGERVNAHAPDRVDVDRELTYAAVLARHEGGMIATRAEYLGYEWPGWTGPREVATGG